MQINYDPQCSGRFWKGAGEAQGSLLVLIPLPQSTPTSQPHSWIQGLYGLTGTGTWGLIILLKDPGTAPTRGAAPVWRVPPLPCKYQFIPLQPTWQPHAALAESPCALPLSSSPELVLTALQV